MMSKLVVGLLRWGLFFSFAQHDKVRSWPPELFRGLFLRKSASASKAHQKANTNKYHKASFSSLPRAQKYPVWVRLAEHYPGNGPR